MKKSSIIAIVIAIVLAIAVIIFFTTRKKKVMQQFTFPSTLVVSNNTHYKSADTLAMVILNRMYSYDTMRINIYYMHGEMSAGGIDIAGYIQKSPFVPHTYNFFVMKTGLPVTMKSFLCHELIHLNQMEKGDLIETLGSTKSVYKGDTINLLEVPYEARPYEIEAFSSAPSIKKKLNTLLYSK